MTLGQQIYIFVRAAETIAKSVRDEAVERMRTRTDGKDGGGAAKKNLKYTVYDLIREDNELEREEKAAERREKFEERR
ncbi:hypothetical protein PInf_001173 [Phytophthora infestans]|nr:hypothetical protein PInf_001173 [Phytophthora infestans]